jgi:catechol 2,3-dioxygenase-like lactoylglutathione lyase family enzyme
MIASLDHFVLTVASIPRSVAFYCGALGMTLVEFRPASPAGELGLAQLDAHCTHPCHQTSNTTARGVRSRLRTPMYRAPTLFLSPLVLVRLAGGSLAPPRTALAFGSQKINLHEAGKEFKPHAACPAPGTADVCFVVARPLTEVRTVRWEEGGAGEEHAPPGGWTSSGSPVTQFTCFGSSPHRSVTPTLCSLRRSFALAVRADSERRGDR